jgi:hypothetical protein
MFSPSAMHFATYITASDEWGDREVSCERINASVPSKTADVISSAS